MSKDLKLVLWHYAVALLAVITAVALRLLLESWLEGNAPLLSFTLAVMLSAWYGGFGPGLFATLLSVLTSAYLFFAPFYSFGIDSPAERTRFVLFSVVGVLISILCESLRRATEGARRDALRARESEEQFRTMANSIPQLVWTARADGHIFWYNRRWFDYTGTTPEQMEGWGWQSVHDAEILPRVLKHWREAIATGEPFEMEFPLRGADGAFRTFLTRVEPLKNSNGAVARWFGTNTDVDELRRDEEAVARSEQHLRRVLNNLFAFVGVLLPDGTLIEANRAPLEAAGIEFADVYGKKVWDTYWMNYDPELRKQIRQSCERAAAGEISRFDVTVQMAGGELMPLDFMIAPMRSGDGEITHLIPSAIDITERKKAEEKLLDTQQRLKSALDAGAVGTWIWDIVNNRVVADENLARMFSIEPEQAAAGNPVEFFTRAIYEDDFARVSTAISETIKTGKPYETEYRLRSEDGRILWVQARGRVEYDAAGSGVRLIGVVVDITERKRTEEALRDSTERLRALSARLQAAREEEGARISREIHDELGQALTGIIIELSWLEERLFERGDRADLIAKIRGTIKIAAEMVDCVRRIATELRPGLLDDFGLTATIEWQAQEFEERTGVKCDLRLDASCANLPRQISTTVFRILQESLTNVARHASATRVNIELTRTENNLSLRVADNGRGASENELAGSRSLGVLGMRERALLLGGSVKISGESGAGTTVEVSIPLSASP